MSDWRNVKKVRTPRLQGLVPGEMAIRDFPFRLKKSRKWQNGTGPCRLRVLSRNSCSC